MKKVKAITYCERCGRPGNGFLVLEVAHVISRGAGGPDIKENCLKLCGPAWAGAGCHGLNHKGKVKPDELFSLIAAREGKSVEEIKEIVHKAWRFSIYEAKS
ncbi:MAG: HNH endonuclease [Sporomusaceae bacterium]|nr:HNH endonuclease [Sporomusaceae bacterium]